MMNKPIDVFPWNSKFETGLIEIDVQHQVLVELLNKLASHIQDPRTSVTEDVFFELAQYADFHFSAEEAIWQQYFEDDDWNKAHQYSHAGFINDVIMMKSTDHTVSQEEEMQKIVSFLINWLAFHILDSDKRMAKVVLAMQKGSSLSEAKKHILSEIFSP